MPVEFIEGLKIPAKLTLDRYGWGLADWLDMAAAQGWTCGVCGVVPKSGQLYIDHEHVRGWKKLAPEVRATYVRGLACYVCNRFVLNYRINARLLEKAVAYLDRYAERREGR